MKLRSTKRFISNSVPLACQLAILSHSIFMCCSKTLERTSLRDRLQRNAKVPPDANGKPLTVKAGVYIESLGKFQATEMVIDNSDPTCFSSYSSPSTGDQVDGESNSKNDPMSFDVDLYLYLSWKDPSLNHTNEDYVLVNDPRVRQHIWLPDLYFSNARNSKFHEVTVPNFNLFIAQDGTIAYSSRITLNVACNLNLVHYPMDRQTCAIRTLSYAYVENQVNITWFQSFESMQPIRYNPDIGLPEFNILRITPDYCDGTYLYAITEASYKTDKFSCLEANIHLRRSIGYHLVQSFIPTGLIVMISWVSFWIDRRAVPARVTLSFTTLLSLSTLGNGLRFGLPQVSYAKSIDFWFGSCMFFVFLSLVEFAAVNSYMRQSEKYEKLANSIAKKRIVITEHANFGSPDISIDKGSLTLFNNSRLREDDRPFEEISCNGHEENINYAPSSKYCLGDQFIKTPSTTNMSASLMGSHLRAGKFPVFSKDPRIPFHSQESEPSLFTGSHKLQTLELPILTDGNQNSETSAQRAFVVAEETTDCEWIDEETPSSYKDEPLRRRNRKTNVKSGYLDSAAIRREASIPLTGKYNPIQTNHYIKLGFLYSRNMRLRTRKIITNKAECAFQCTSLEAAKVAKKDRQVLAKMNFQDIKIIFSKNEFSYHMKQLKMLRDNVLPKNKSISVTSGLSEIDKKNAIQECETDVSEKRERELKKIEKLQKVKTVIKEQTAYKPVPLKKIEMDFNCKDQLDNGQTQAAEAEVIFIHALSSKAQKKDSAEDKVVLCLNAVSKEQPIITELFSQGDVLQHLGDAKCRHSEHIYNANCNVCKKKEHDKAQQHKAEQDLNKTKLTNNCDTQKLLRGQCPEQNDSIEALTHRVPLVSFKFQPINAIQNLRVKGLGGSSESRELSQNPWLAANHVVWSGTLLWGREFKMYCSLKALCNSFAFGIGSILPNEINVIGLIDAKMVSQNVLCMRLDRRKSQLVVFHLNLPSGSEDRKSYAKCYELMKIKSRYGILDIANHPEIFDAFVLPFEKHELISEHFKSLEGPGLAIDVEETILLLAFVDQAFWTSQMK